MEARELRIGNYVYYNDKVISIAPNAINEFYYIGDTHSESLVDRRCYKPIELTEEILLKCGFEKHVFKSETTKTHLLEFTLIDSDIDLIYFDMNRPEHGFYFGCWESSKCPKYLHQLQNLYFALTNEELNIQL